MNVLNEIQAIHSIHHAAVALIAPGTGARDFSLRTATGLNRTILQGMKEEVRATGHTIVTMIYGSLQNVPRRYARIGVGISVVPVGMAGRTALGYKRGHLSIDRPR